MMYHVIATNAHLENNRCARWSRVSHSADRAQALAPAPPLGLASRSGKRSAVDDVVVNALEPVRKRAEQLVRQAFEEQPANEVDVAARCEGDLIPPLIGERYLGCPSIGRSETTVDEPSLLEAPGVGRAPAPLPADPRGQRRDSHAPAWRVPQRVQDVVVRQRKVAVRLQLAIHLVCQT